MIIVYEFYRYSSLQFTSTVPLRVACESNVSPRSSPLGGRETSVFAGCVKLYFFIHRVLRQRCSAVSHLKRVHLESQESPRDEDGWH